jgi:uncharacterized protein YihD (DUF1040 family)
MKYLLTIVAIVGGIQILAYFYLNQERTYEYDFSKFELNYRVTGMGSNMSSKTPDLFIRGNDFIYTEYASLRREGQLKDTLQIGVLKDASILSIIQVLEKVPKYEIYKTNAATMSGSVLNLTIKYGSSKWKFTIHNAYDENISKIIDILNQNFSKENQLEKMDFLKDFEAFGQQMKSD